MALKGVFGDSRRVNFELLREACNNYPSLFIDCNNCANPHLMFGIVSDEALHNVFVVQAESMYRFSTVLKELEDIAEQLNVKRIIISTFDRLFNFQNELENRMMNQNLWEMIKTISDSGISTEIITGVNSKSREHMSLAQKYCRVLESWELPLQAKG